MIGSTRVYVIFPNDQSYVSTYNEGRDAFVENDKNLAAISDPETRELVNDLYQLGESYDEIMQNVFRLVNEKNIAQARVEVIKPRIRDVLDRRNRLVNELESQLNQTNQAARNSRSFLLGLIIIGTGLMILATILY